MSFILDALQKSETDRRRAASPALAGTAIGPQQVAVPGWIWAVIILLLITVLGLAAAWWSSARGPGALGGAAAIADDRAEPLASARAVGQAVGSTASAAEQSDRREDSGAQPATRVTAEASATGSATAASERQQVPAGSAAPGSSAVPVSSAATGAQPASTRPASEAARVAPPPAGPRPTLPTLSELGAEAAGIPDINLELHVYHPSPTSRWVYINGGRYTEGQVTGDGTRLVEIVPEGVVLNHAGRDFLLLAQ